MSPKLVPIIERSGDRNGYPYYAVARTMLFSYAKPDLTGGKLATVYDSGGDRSGPHCGPDDRLVLYRKVD